MTESEILTLQIEIVNTGWAILQTWLGATFGVVMAAHFVARSFNLFLCVGMLAMYTVFSLTFIGQEMNLLNRLDAIVQDLLDLERGGYTLSHNARMFVDFYLNGYVPSIYKISMISGTIASVFYVLYRYRQSRGPDDADEQ